MGNSAGRINFVTEFKTTDAIYLKAVANVEKKKKVCDSGSFLIREYVTRVCLFIYEIQLLPSK